MQLLKIITRGSCNRLSSDSGLLTPGGAATLRAVGRLKVLQRTGFKITNPLLRDFIGLGKMLMSR